MLYDRVYTPSFFNSKQILPSHRAFTFQFGDTRCEYPLFEMLRNRSISDFGLFQILEYVQRASLIHICDFCDAPTSLPSERHISSQSFRFWSLWISGFQIRDAQPLTYLFCHILLCSVAMVCWVLTHQHPECKMMLSVTGVE